MYPQTVVPLTSDIHNHLRDNHAGQTGDVKLLDGVYYTANIDKDTWIPDDVNTWEKNPVYQYGSDRYVRVSPYSANGTSQYVYNNNGGTVGRVTVSAANADSSKYRWFKVDPIKWIILNYDKITITQLNEKRNDELGFVTDFARENVSGVNVNMKVSHFVT